MQNKFARFHFRLRGPVLSAVALGSALLVAATLTPAHAQSFSIDWYTIDGGGGTSTGGAYQLSGTIGQSDAGAMSGGNYSLTGGFWSIISVVQNPPGPLLSIRLTATNTVVISWPSPSTGFVLMANGDSSSHNWVQVAQTPIDDGTTKRVVLPSRPGNLLLRLQK
jgi:hypothetical protein